MQSPRKHSPFTGQAIGIERDNFPSNPRPRKDVTPMPKTPKGPKKVAPPKSTKLPRKLPDDPIARGVAIMREATADKSKPSKKR